ncbi:MAG: aspartate kinase, partial [Lachnospiraceae bacterium]|nr:aspartate kinase [Lachnospiraceae bacterium]
EKAGRDYAASRGEYLNGIVMAAYLGYEFIDAATVIRFNEEGHFLPELTNELLGKRLENVDSAVIPGFYGAREDGTVVTFSRGGSDITGSIVARAIRADMYENWTDVSGFLVADPRIVENPEVIETITYSELRELSYMGAGVLHEDAIFPVRKEGIPINIKNTNRPEDPGTLIVESTCRKPRFTITGIAGKKNFASVTIEKDMMNSEIGFGRKVLTAFEENDLSFEHVPSGIDTMTVFVDQHAFEEKEQNVISALHRLVEPDSVEVDSDLALIAIVGRGMRSTRGTAGRIFSALAHARVNVRMIDQGSSELNVIVGVDNADFETAIRAIYDIFVTTNI